MLGDLPRGNNDPTLCTFGRNISPNHHALAEQFVLLDNYYCNGVCSADGHAWATEGFAVDYLEKAFGSWSPSELSTLAREALEPGAKTGAAMDVGRHPVSTASRTSPAG